MAGLRDSLEQAGNKPYVWLEGRKYADESNYAQLVQPESWAGLKKAGIKHLAIDLADHFNMSNDRLLDGSVKPERLAAEIRESPTFHVFQTFSESKLTPEHIAQIMLLARENGVQLHFTANSSLQQFDGRQVSSARESDELAGKERLPRESFEGLAAKMGGGREGLAKASILRDHHQHLDRLKEVVDGLPAGERVLILHQGNLPLERSVESVLGVDKVQHIQPGIEVNLPRLEGSDSRPAQRQTLAFRR